MTKMCYKKFRYNLTFYQISSEEKFFISSCQEKNIFFHIGSSVIKELYLRDFFSLRENYYVHFATHKLAKSSKKM
jgi:hypothetical protein